ncbi:MAG: NADH-quinone oxidoreductase subunit J, partial [Luteolibacter sp.]
MPSYLFWFFATLVLVGGAAVVVFRNPVSSALAVVASFVGLAGLFIGLSAFFVGIIQILVYTGAVMVLFLFIIMLLDLKDEEKRGKKFGALAAGIALAVLFSIQLVGVLSMTPDKEAPPIDPSTMSLAAENFDPETGIASSLKEGRLPDTQLLGHTIFT